MTRPGGNDDDRKLTWRQLLSNPPSAWQRLSLLTRGVGDELLRALDGNGELDCGRDDPFAVVCRITGAHPRERRRVREAIDDLIRERFLVLIDRGGERVLRGQLPDLSTGRAPLEASPRPTQSEPESDPKRTQSEPEPDVKLTRSEPEVASNSSESFNVDPESREEERREENRRGEESERRAREAPLFTPAAIVESEYETALGAVGAKYAPRTGDALHFRESAEAIRLAEPSRALRDVAGEWARRYALERRTRSPAYFAEWCQRQLASDSTKHVKKGGNAYMPPSPHSAFANAPSIESQLGITGTDHE